MTFHRVERRHSGKISRGGQNWSAIPPRTAHRADLTRAYPAAVYFTGVSTLYAVKRHQEREIVRPLADSSRPQWLPASRKCPEPSSSEACSEN